MSSLRAIQLPTAPIAVAPAAVTDAYVRPRIRPETPEWHHDVEAVVRAVGRFGLGPIPATLLGFGIVLGLSLRVG